MKRALRSVTRLTIYSCLAATTAQAQLPNLQVLPTDKFTTAFLKAYRSSTVDFKKVAGKPAGMSPNVFNCYFLLPGAQSGTVTTGARPACTFRFGSYDQPDGAEGEMVSLTNKVASAFLQRTLIRYYDAPLDSSFVRRTALAEVRGDGFTGFNVLVDVVRSVEGKYDVQMTLLKSANIFYRFIHKNEPFRSPLFVQNFRHIYAQFTDGTAHTCGELLPGFNCSVIDSNGHKVLLMEKFSPSFRDAQVEFETLTSNIRAMLNEKYLYYLPEADGKRLRQAVFVSFDDYEVENRKSISTSIVKDGEDEYAVRTILYRP